MKRKIFIIFIAFFLMAFYESEAQSSKDTKDVFFFHSEGVISKDENIILLPGSSGLKIFKDYSFYYRKADTLCKLGYKVLLIDYKSYYKHHFNSVKNLKTTGEKIEAVIKQVIKESLSNKTIKNGEKIHLIGWSLAGEGVFKILKDTSFLMANNISSASLFYPSNQGNLSVTSKIPLLIQIGDLDNVVSKDLLYKQISDKMNIEFVVLENSHHGFDILTISKPKNIKLPPILGKKYTFASNKDSEKKANNYLISFLNNQSNK